MADTYAEMLILFTWALLPSTLLIYALSDYDEESPPSWVALDIVNLKLKYTAVKDTSEVTYKFAISITIAGVSKVAYKLVYLTVTQCCWPA